MGWGDGAGELSRDLEGCWFDFNGSGSHGRLYTEADMLGLVFSKNASGITEKTGSAG